MMKIFPMLLMLFAVACSSSPVPSNIIPPEKMKLLVFDMMRADEFVNNYVLRDTSLKTKEEHIKMYEQVFLINKTNHDEFYKSFKYYQHHPEINKVLYDSLLTYANKQRENLLEPTKTVILDSTFTR